MLPPLKRPISATAEPDDTRRASAVQAVRAAMQAIVAKRGVSLTVQTLHENGVAACAPWLMQQLDAAVKAQGIAVRRLPSGAGHDGMAMIDLCDIGMLFVRCKGGISHNPAEAVAVDDVAAGARALLHFIEHFKPEKRQ